MRRIFLFFAAMLVTMFSVAQPSFNGTYTGAEKLCWRKTAKDSCDNSDNENPKWRWFRLGVLRIKADSVFLDQSPISIYKKDTSFSASDGGFFYYSGTLAKQSDTSFTIRLKEIFCDYCGQTFFREKEGSRKKVYRTITYTCRLSAGGFWANDIFYKRVDNNEPLTSENPKPYLQ